MIYISIMSLRSVSASDVRRHLRALGYPEVSDDQLKEFLRDLRRLIRHEEREERRKEQVGVLKGRQRTRRASESSSTSAYSSSASTAGDAEDDLFKKQARKKKRAEWTAVRTQESYSESTMSTTSRSREEGGTSAATTVSRSESVTSSERVVLRVHLPSRDDDIPDGPPRRSRRRSQSEPRRFGPPTTSFIRPSLAKASSVKKCDPVRLHAAYQEHWKRLRLPGDGSDKSLRWAVREWMMGPREEP